MQNYSYDYPHMYLYIIINILLSFFQYIPAIYQSLYLSVLYFFVILQQLWNGIYLTK